MTIVIIAEKPDAMERLAKALAEDNLKRRTSRYKVDFFEFERNGKKHIAVCAVGHLFGLKQKGKGWTYPIFDIEWLPTFKTNKTAAFTERYYRTIEEIAKLKDLELVSATDYDNEGSVIAANIIKFIFKKKDAGRMKFSTLTKQDLVKAYDEMAPHLDEGNIDSGITRHFLDFYYGMSTTRALTLAAKKFSNRFNVISAGRVQGPTLTMLANREIEIQKFEPVPYWQLLLILDKDGIEIEAVFEEDKIWDEKKAKKIFDSCKDKKAAVKSIEKKKHMQNPPAPFNITSLQTESYRLFGYSPQQTLKIAQKLYTSAYISYPRTSSEKLPPQIGYREILQALSKVKNYSKSCKKLLAKKILKPTEGKRTDPAHEAIHPTVEPPKRKLGIPDQRIYDLICKRFFSCFGDPASRETVKINFDLNGNIFLASGTRTVDKGWIELYMPFARFEEIMFPDLKKGDMLDVKKLDMLKKETAPPSRYSQASIIKEMEKRGLGTRATRANILQTLYDRDYILGRSIKVTALGMKVANALRNYVPDFVDEKLTRAFEKDIEKISAGKIKSSSVLSKGKKAVEKICVEFKEHEDEIGKELGEAILKVENDKSILGICPSCGGVLKIMYSPRTKKMFVGCDSWSKCKVCGLSKTECKCKCPKCGKQKGKCKCTWQEKDWQPTCNQTYPLPGGAAIYRTDKVCDKCKTPIISVYRRGRKPFKMCLETTCETKANWGKPKISKKK
ncbi:MAG: DNA topoisomerase I [Candidatus Aenigmarchaeota archaeon]|nr:DNA topoisomerase I [Candidatus Aenigmarchaeota archaeon]